LYKISKISLCEKCLEKIRVKDLLDFKDKKSSASNKKIAFKFNPFNLLLIFLFLLLIFLTISEFFYIRHLNSEINSLKEKRQQLLFQIKDRNKEISVIKNQNDSLIFLLEQKQNNKEVKELKSYNKISFKSINGIPLTFNNGSVLKPLIALTFDGGSIANIADEILDTLKSRNVKATMFLTGEFIRKFPDIVKRIVNEGHELGNHTFSHPHLTTYSADNTQTTLPSVNQEFILNQLQKTDSILQKVAGVSFKPIWRAPFGEYNNTICLWAQKAGYIHIGWRQGKSFRQGLDSNDWISEEESLGYFSPEDVFNKIIVLAKEKPHGINGGIILMHLGTKRSQKEKQVHRILGMLIDTLNSSGYSFVTITQMLQESDINIDNINKNNIFNNN